MTICDISDKITRTADSPRTRLLGVIIIQPPINRTREHFSSAYCDPYPLHIPSLNIWLWIILKVIQPSVPSGSLVVNLTVFGTPTKLPWLKKAKEAINLQRWPMVNSRTKHNLSKERYISIFKANNFLH